MAEGRTPSWMAEIESRSAERGPEPVRPVDPGPAAGPRPVDVPAALPARDGSLSVSSPLRDLEETGLARLRDEASRAAHRDAARHEPGPNDTEPAPGENDLRERCRAFFERWSFQQRRWLSEQVADREQEINDRLGRASLKVDRYDRLTNELMRLKARRAARHREVADELEGVVGGERGLPTRVYLVAIAFLGVVEFFANAPVFSALLPRDPLTERQIRLVAETSQGWWAGAERVISHLILRPDAALLAAGVVTFLCVLAHFFGHSLRELVMQQDVEERHHTVSARSKLENLIPIALTGVGLLLVLGVLYEARIRLGEVGQEQYRQDVAVVQELRRQAEFQRADNNLLEANSLLNRADDMEGAAVSLRDYAGSMSRLSFPILLLNLTLVICAICAAYFHRRDRRREHFNESPFERDRRNYIESAENAAEEITRHLAELARDIRTLRGLGAASAEEDRRGLVHELESVIAHYRAENARARGIDLHAVPALAGAVTLEVDRDDHDESVFAPLQPAEEYERQRRSLHERFEGVRRRFNEDAVAW